MSNGSAAGEEKLLWPFDNKPQTSTELVYIVLVITLIYGPEQWEVGACTGTLLRADLVLTTASCLLQSGDEPDPINTLVYERPTGLERQALSIHLHPSDCQDSGLPSCYDFAAIYIETTEQTEFPDLPSDGQRLEGESGDCVLGGYDNKKNDLLGSFKMVKLGATSRKILKCRSGADECTPSTVYLQVVLPCPTAVGSPIVCNHTVLAMYSPKFLPLSVKCFDSHVAKFFYVSDAVDWLESLLDSPQDAMDFLNNSVHCVLVFLVAMMAVVGIYVGIMQVMQIDRFINAQDPEE